MGGIALVDLEAHTQALQAGVAAMLLHPKRLPWKGLMAASVHKAFPGVGLAVFVQHCSHHRLPPRLPARHGAYLRAFRQLGIHRRTQQDNMTKEQIALEVLTGNHSVANVDGYAFSGPTTLPTELRGMSRLQEVPEALLDTLKLPATWTGKLASPSACSWHVDSHAKHVRFMGAGPTQYYGVQHDNRLEAAVQVPAVSGWHLACVVDTPHPTDPDAVIKYLVGPWSAVQVDPTVWGVGDNALLTYEVKNGTARIIQWQCRTAPRWVAGAGIRPKLWGTQGGSGPAGVAAVADIASRQKRRFEELASAAGGSGAGRGRILVEDLAPLYHASWFDSSPPQLHVRQRVEGRDALVTQQRLAQKAQQDAILFPLIDDTLDPIGSTAGADASPAWCKAWQRAFHKRLPRPTRVFAWRLLHGALRCGGATAAFLPPGDPDLQGARCKNPGCNVLPVRPLETLQHLFMECAPAKRAVEWLCALWSQIAPNQQAPPCLPHVILADDASAWAPSQQLASLWGLLRLTMLKRIWLARCELVENGSGASACSTPGIVCAFVREIRALI